MFYQGSPVFVESGSVGWLEGVVTKRDKDKVSVETSQGKVSVEAI